jgi:hypothetical protein
MPNGIINKEIVMKLKLNKKKVKSLTKDKATLPAEVTPQVGGASYVACMSDFTCDDAYSCRYCGMTKYC